MWTALTLHASLAPVCFLTGIETTTSSNKSNNNSRTVEYVLAGRARRIRIYDAAALALPLPGRVTHCIWRFLLPFGNSGAHVCCSVVVVFVVPVAVPIELQHVCLVRMAVVAVVVA